MHKFTGHGSRGFSMISIAAFNQLRRASGRRAAHGFTLVELLVVIGIIAVLIAILMPALQQARAEARKLECLSNMRQLGIAMMGYFGENQGFLPYQATDQVLTFNTAGANENWLASLLPYLNNNIHVLVCPDAYYPIAFPADLAPDVNDDTNYLANGVVMGRRITVVPQPTQIICIQENVWDVNVAWLEPHLNPGITYNGSATYAEWHSPYTGWPSGETYCAIHNRYQTGNVIFVDGHGETRAFKGNHAGDFGLNPASEGWGPSNNTNAVNGTPYTAAF
jgi:prepilin-type N-terminal cleavage/methylation domain-containing protein/prepilin-type processing-associated H-X9-DG protein